ncbi:RagB/SusD family nutrient uptake outer membrane protein [Antarcticibacterium sp. 1MA-6-2]|uniref:RagB/SusD family nutrient uptake outer membrane protein n=1 Tax=Antarcticibacterium sp. 1MA-6-2 TaxID=2908210 RepID=UPI001F47DBC8|nr:RagB/SusD family nutrient uptake outer membrane protein [Antarcticibacterium sp. 1MA-6-2]UJH89801.1 RagB/SusD family nutrient uptake outer membrane protein [Antarcticibacterium sp. 1MA-6-2]
MKTIKLKYFTTGIMFLLVLASCNDLDRFPHDAIERSQSFQSVQDASNWNTGMYGQLRNRVYGLYMYSTDIQADQLNATLDYGNRNGGVHRWDFLADDYTIRDTWQSYYSGITSINAAIEGFETIETETEEEAAELNQYISEAYLTRAYYYHQLILRFSKSYDPATASSDLGVPLMLEYDIENFAPRSSVQAVYDQILADIETARDGLADVPGVQGSKYYTSDVVTALEARVKFYMQDWQGAKEAADELITSGRYPLITSEEGLMAYWYQDGGQEDILQLFVSAPDELANTNSIYLGFNGGT